MTLPDERYRAIKMAREFLWSLLDRSATPRVPKEIRLRARSVLKHYPGEFDMQNVLDNGVKGIFAKEKKWDKQ